MGRGAGFSGALRRPRRFKSGARRWIAAGTCCRRTGKQTPGDPGHPLPSGTPPRWTLSTAVAARCGTCGRAACAGCSRRSACGSSSAVRTAHSSSSRGPTTGTASRPAPQRSTKVAAPRRAARCTAGARRRARSLTAADGAASAGAGFWGICRSEGLAKSTIVREKFPRGVLGTSVAPPLRWCSEARLC